MVISSEYLIDEIREDVDKAVAGRMKAHYESSYFKILIMNIFSKVLFYDIKKER